MRKIRLIGLTLILSLGLLGCNTPSDNPEDTNDDVPIDEEKETDENKQDESDLKNDSEDSQSVVVNTGPTETVSRVIEGMDEEVEVINYQIKPYDISYQLDETLGEPEAKDNEIIYSTQSDDYKITLKIIEYTNLGEAASILQEQYKSEEYEEKSKLESTPQEENDLKGMMQSFTYPDMQGFYIYEFDEHVLAISYKYPVEGGDGMGPLLEAFRKSINLH